MKNYLLMANKDTIHKESQESIEKWLFPSDNKSPSDLSFNIKTPNNWQTTNSKNMQNSDQTNF